MSDDKVVPFVQKIKDLMPGADNPNQVWQCPCGCQAFNLRADYHIECVRCDLKSPFKYFDERLI